MFKSRHFLFSTLFFALLPSFVLGAESSPIEYVAGTVKAIPANSTGAFNFEDAKQLQFNYGSSSYALAYEQITAADIEKGPTHHVLRKIPVPAFSRNPIETLTISYKDAAGANGTLSFQLTANQAAEIRSTIASKKAAIAADVEARSTDWWGDKYWKTNRNQPGWDAQNTPANPSSPSAATK
jgi:hypothetical protein